MRHTVVILLLASCCAFGQRGPGRGPGVRGGGYRGHYGGAVIVPYPAYVGGGYYSGYAAPPPSYGYGYDPSYYSNPGYGAPAYGAPAYGPDPSQSPYVVVNPNFSPDAVNPQIRDYSNVPLPPPPPDPQATIYLIAMKDHTIFPAVGYWVEGDTLNYVTSEGVRNKVSLALVDRDFSTQLNHERNVEFKLPRRTNPLRHADNRDRHAVAQRNVDALCRLIAPRFVQTFSGYGGSHFEGREACLRCGTLTSLQNLAANAPPGPIRMHKKSADLRGFRTRVK